MIAANFSVFIYAVALDAFGGDMCTNTIPYNANIWLKIQEAETVVDGLRKNGIL